VDRRLNTRNEELVEHLVRCMEQEGLTIEAANAPGYRRPRPVKSGLWRARFCPDVVARDGRRVIFGVVQSEVAASSESFRNQLETFASKCRMLVICVPGHAADRAVEVLFHNADMPHWRKMRLLRHPNAKWQDVPKRAKTRRRNFDHPTVTVVEEGHLLSTRMHDDVIQDG
jgi:hypothetical protein